MPKVDLTTIEGIVKVDTSVIPKLDVINLTRPDIEGARVASLSVGTVFEFKGCYYVKVNKHSSSFEFKKCDGSVCYSFNTGCVECLSYDFVVTPVFGELNVRKLSTSDLLGF